MPTKKEIKKVMSDLGKKSWAKSKAKKDSDYFRKLQLKGVQKRLENKVKTGKY